MTATTEPKDKPIEERGAGDYGGWATLSDGSRVPLSAAEARSLWKRIESHKTQRSERMPTQGSALRALGDAYERLREFGWREAIYCPKDGSEFEVIEAGSTGVHRCHYEGDWPHGSWWIHDAGDLWPSRPILFRPLPGPSPDAISDPIMHGDAASADVGGPRLAEEE